MTDVFQKRRYRLRAMKQLLKTYLPAEQRVQCPSCLVETAIGAWEENLCVCQQCGYHWPIGAQERLKMIMDAGKYRLMFEEVVSRDPLAFPGYVEKLEKAQNDSSLSEAAAVAKGMIDGQRCVVCVLDSRFMMGSMGEAVGERIVLAVEYAQRNRLALIIFSASGGARMQEGIVSLMQMAKTSAAIRRFSDKGLLFISVLTDPTMGGVTASFASLGDVILAEPGALIGFAGPRVIEQTIGEKLPEDFQRAEFLMEHGFVDAVVDRRNLRAAISRLLRLHGEGKA